jgi:pSer/pThr/pTyr-binding forkhead associated (FHA) protein
LSPIKNDRKVVLRRFPSTVGRSGDAEVKIIDHWVSRHHCELNEVNGMLVVRDLGSKHGTYVNGRQVFEAHLLPDDKLTVGMTSFVASYRAATTAARREGCAAEK